jgi:hypothetical protein
MTQIFLPNANDMIVTTADLYQLAYSRYAIGAYNINNLEQALGLFKAVSTPWLLSLFNSRKARGNTPTKGRWKS